MFSSVRRCVLTFGSFRRTQCDTFARSGTAVFELSTRFADPFVADKSTTAELQEQQRKLLFLELTQVCLWGNSTDLSLLINVR